MADVDPDQPDLDPRQPLVQGRAATSSSRATRRASGGVGAGPWAGQFNFSTDTSNPLDTNYSYANALLGTFRDYTEIDAFSEVIGKRYIAEFYVQDTWKANRRLTFDFGVRFLWYTPWYSTQPAAVFVPERYDPAKAPRLYQPAVINGVERRLRSGDRRDVARTCSSAASFPAPAIATTAWSAAAIPITRGASATTRASSRNRGSGWRGT